MTSKSLYSNLVKEDMKRRIWTLALAMLIFVIGLPIYALLRLERMKELIEYGGIASSQAYFAEIAGNDSGLLIIITFAGALICAINGFSYLFSKSKVDLYHSIPVRREKLFIITYINGILIYVIPYFINLVLYFIVGAANGMLTKDIWNSSMKAFGVNLSGYVLLYSVIIIAVMMTGNIIVCFLGTATFMLYGTAVLVVQSALCHIFFKTYYQPFADQDKFRYASPLFAYYHLSTLIGKSGFTVYFIGFVAATIIAIAIGIYLYRIRPSEAAGKSMAFPVTQIPIKFLIVLPTTIVGGLLFMDMSETTSFTWMLFGIVFIGFLSHGIIEIIYNNDFKFIVAHKLHLVIGIALSLIIAMSVKLDWYHYDAYIPNANKVESMSISFEGLEQNDEYYDFEKEYYDARQYAYYKYVPATTYQLEHMNITNFDSIYQLVKYAKDNNIREEERTKLVDNDTLITFTVKYTFKNKTEKYRDYTVKFNDIISYLNDIYVDESYKEGVYQILTMDRELVNSISCFNSAEGSEEMLKLTPQQKQEFLDIYTNELKLLTSTDLLESVPVTQLIFMLGNSKNYISQSYYVYPRFTKTIEYLKTLGANFDNVMNPDNIASITITDYRNEKEVSEINPVEEAVVDEKVYESDVREYTFTDPKQIEAITKALIPERLTWGTKSGLNISRDFEVIIEYKLAGSTGASIVVEKLPDDMKQQLDIK